MKFGESRPTSRREAIKRFASAAAGALLYYRRAHGTSGPARLLSLPRAVECTRWAKSVRPIIGTGWHGHTFPGATTPLGLVQASPDSFGAPWPWYEWDHSAGYHFRDHAIAGFSHTHMQGTGAPELGDLLLMPLTRGCNWAWDRGTPGHGYSSRFSHRCEIASAAYYAVILETPHVLAELTATAHCGMHRYSAGHGAPDGLLLDLAHGVGCTALHAELNVENNFTLSGYRVTQGWAPERWFYFVLEFSQPISLPAEMRVDGSLATTGTAHIVGKEIQARFSWNMAVREPLLVRVGISGTSVEGARKNLRWEIPGWDFDAVCAESEAEWDSLLGRLDADLPDHALEKVFYTAAWHGMTTPIIFNDVDGAWRGKDQQIHQASNIRHYSTISTWDICRSEFPFLMLMQPERVDEIIQTLLEDYEQLGQESLPYFPLWNNETWSQTGFHAVAMILGAYVRGFRSFNPQKAYAAMRETALVGAAANGNRSRQQEFRQRGYISTGPHRESVFYTLDFAYDYWCVGAMARLLGKEEDAAYFERLGRNYRNVFDRHTGFMRGKDAKGNWREPFRPDEEYWQDYTESDAWQATFMVLHDIQGLITLMGGDDAFSAKLDALFAASPVVRNAPPDISGLIGQDAQGNEPSNHIPYLYVFAGAPWKTQYWARRIMMRWYSDTPEGIPGNEDVGQLSSWFALGALGFYPVNGANGVYVIGSPLVRHCQLSNQRSQSVFTVVAENNSPANVYIQSVRLNGALLERSWISHDEIAAGGELIFRMGPRPNKEWATSPAMRPPSGIIPQQD